VGGSEPIHLNMQIIFERTSIQMIKFEKRKKKRKKGTTLEKECTSASLDVHYFHVSSHYRLLRRPEILTKKKRSTSTQPKKVYFLKDAKVSPNWESNITLPLSPSPRDPIVVGK
jgi:hypothetical protein